MKKLLKVARKRAGLKLFDVKGGVAQLRHVPGDCLVQKVLGPEEMLEDGQYITEDGAVVRARECLCGSSGRERFRPFIATNRR
jgi:hypothetical protein